MRKNLLRSCANIIQSCAGITFLRWTPSMHNWRACERIEISILICASLAPRSGQRLWKRLLWFKYSNKKTHHLDRSDDPPICTCNKTFHHNIVQIHIFYRYHIVQVSLLFHHDYHQRVSAIHNQTKIRIVISIHRNSSSQVIFERI